MKGGIGMAKNEKEEQGDVITQLRQHGTILIYLSDHMCLLINTTKI